MTCHRPHPLEAADLADGSAPARSRASRSRRRTSTASPRSTATCTRSSTSRERSGAARPDRRPAPRASRRRAGRRADRHQRRALHDRHAVDLRLEDPRGLDAAVRRHRRREAPRGRPRAARQDQHGRVRDGLVDRVLGLRPDPQPVGPRPHPRRLGRRLGRGRRGLRGAARPRHRHRRLDPPAGRRHGHGRRQAHLRRRQPLRRDRARLLASTRWAPSAARCSTPPCSTTSSGGTTAATRPL